MEGVSLSEAGRDQARQLAACLAGRSIAAVVSSPLERARQTAEPIAAAVGLEVAIDPGLNEIDFGAWTGQAFRDLDGLPEWDAWNSFRSTARCPGGETMLQAQGRALATVSRLREAHQDGEVVLVGHQDVLKAVLAHFLAVPLDLLQRIALDPARRAVVTLLPADVRVDGLNLPPYIPA